MYMQGSKLRLTNGYYPNNTRNIRMSLYSSGSIVWTNTKMHIRKTYWRQLWSKNTINYNYASYVLSILQLRPNKYVRSTFKMILEDYSILIRSTAARLVSVCACKHARVCMCSCTCVQTCVCACVNAYMRVCVLKVTKSKDLDWCSEYDGFTL